MKRLLAVGSMLLIAGGLMLPATASAQAYDTNTGCGLGNQLFKQIGQDKVLYQILAVTTNGILGNQTFGISTGTLGCRAPADFAQNEKVERFVADNMDSLAQDIASGSGESLSTLAELMEVPAESRTAFYSRLQSSFNVIYTSSAVQSADVIEGIYRVASNS
jgi:hypothetical protein